ncbi:hypothetical protein BN946_scf184983.g41 [Trametes cinnabarina]|uniref:Uncharacterized protein n=1 Tax=Pycnoporus cinnabarinus TaxID=5643 RepID=A0A060SJD1_PYCCI|nr:hypothetical protein BN946_scf184983.g41 [Trametes cinnabarina]
MSFNLSSSVLSYLQRDHTYTDRQAAIDRPGTRPPAASSHAAQPPPQDRSFSPPIAFPPPTDITPPRPPAAVPLHPPVLEEDDPDLPLDLKPKPEFGHLEEMGAPRAARLRELRTAQLFVEGLRNARLDESGMSLDAIHRLRNPPTGPRDITDHERAGLRMFLVKRLVAELTGIDAIEDHMCPNTCVGYVGAYARLEECPVCKEPRYDPAYLTRNKKVPHRTFQTYPLGPQVQAMSTHPDHGRLMRHQLEVTQRLLGMPIEDVQAEMDDVFYGTAYLNEVCNGRISDNDTIVMMSLDGAQLYQSKASDSWFYIWVIFELSPDRRYKKRYVLPGGVIGGPNKPKNVDSFMYPGLYHTAALQLEGLSLWNAAENRLYISYIYLLLAGADRPGMAYLSGLVGHLGRYGCRLFCGIPGRLKPSSNTYYPAMLRPTNPLTIHSAQPDFSARVNPASQVNAQVRYRKGLAKVEGSRTLAQYQQNRVETGIAKPSIFSGLSRILPLPACFPADLMHLIALNLPDLILGLLHASLPCDEPDDKATWDWAVFVDRETWQQHGKLVAQSTRFLPGSFDRPPRNPAEKLTSGYKAWEFLTYVYGLLPGFLRAVQKPQYYRNFCKLVFGVRIVLQRKLKHAQLVEAHQSLVEHAEEFEELYYQRRAERLHFVRQSIHATTHIVPEALRMGPGASYTQWTIENYIGNITREIKQHVTPFANVSERALHRCQCNALRALYPAFSNEDTLPQASFDLGDGYALLQAREKRPCAVRNWAEAASIIAYLRSLHHPAADAWAPIVQRWARLLLPNGQILQDETFAEVRFFFQYVIGEDTHTLAMVSQFSTPDIEILQESAKTLMVCNYQGDDALRVIRATEITSVVAMVPLPMTPAEAAEPGSHKRYATRYFVVEKMGLDITILAGNVQNNVNDEG